MAGAARTRTTATRAVGRAGREEMEKIPSIRGPAKEGARERLLALGSTARAGRGGGYDYDNYHHGRYDYDHYRGYEDHTRSYGGAAGSSYGDR